MMGRARARTLKAEAGVHESHRTLRGLVCISESVLCYMIALIGYANFLFRVLASGDTQPELQRPGKPRGAQECPRKGVQWALEKAFVRPYKICFA